MPSNTLHFKAARPWLAALLILIAAGSIGSAKTDPIHPFPADLDPSARLHTVRAGTSTIRVAIAPGKLRVSDEVVVAWVSRCAAAVSAYFGRFPTEHYTLLILPADGDTVSGGWTTGENGAYTSIHLGSDCSVARLDREWMLTHEMVHLAFPNVSSIQHWAEEGMATYVEPIARVMIHNLTAADVWRDTMEDMPQGLPQKGDAGLDHTPTWGRTYWGGALFYQLADVEIRKRTLGKKGLIDAMRAILEQQGNITVDRDLMPLLITGDKATGANVLVPLYMEMRASPHPVNLADLWQTMGIRLTGAGVLFQNDAHLAWLRPLIIPEK